jgi:hypothetical protein
LPIGLRRICEKAFLDWWELSNRNSVSRSSRAGGRGSQKLLIFGNLRGGQAAAILYSVVQSARLYHLDVTAYLTDVLRRLPAILPTKNSLQKPPAAEDATPNEGRRWWKTNGSGDKSATRPAEISWAYPGLDINVISALDCVVPIAEYAAIILAVAVNSVQYKLAVLNSVSQRLRRFGQRINRNDG